MSQPVRRLMDDMSLADATRAPEASSPAASRKEVVAALFQEPSPVVGVYEEDFRKEVLKYCSPFPQQLLPEADVK